MSTARYENDRISAKGGRPDVDTTHLRPVLICAGETTTEVES